MSCLWWEMLIASGGQQTGGILYTHGQQNCISTNPNPRDLISGTKVSAIYLEVLEGERGRVGSDVGSGSGVGMSIDKGAMVVIDEGVFDHTVDVPDYDVVVIV
jgi:hypothetical protein